MANLAQFELPVGMQDVLRQFEEWRSLHAGRRPIPEALWVLATDLAREHGVFRTAKVLRLDYNKLKRQIPSTQPDAKPPTAYRSAFVKLLSPDAPTPCECTVEVEGPRGRMRIEWKGPAIPDLVGLSRTLWELNGQCYKCENDTAMKDLGAQTAVSESPGGETEQA